MKAIKFFSIFLVGITLVMASCSGDSHDESTQVEDATVNHEGVDTAAFLADLEAIEQKLNTNFDMPTEEDLKDAATIFQDFATIFPDSPEAPDYLLKASDMALAAKQPEKSVNLLERIINDYPDYKKMEDVKYNRASHLDFELRDTTAAKEAYQEFMVEYPDSPMINDCESRIKNIRYSMEELTEMFMSELENQ